MIKNFLEEYEKIKGKTFYIIQKMPEFETVTDNGHYEVLKRTVPTIVEYKVSPKTIKLLLTEKIYFNKEDANWDLLIMPIDVERYRPEIIKKYSDEEWILQQYMKQYKGE